MTRLYLVTEGECRLWVAALVEAGVGMVDEEQAWREDRRAMGADVVFASLAADLS
jgi:hypothetical protein